MILAGNRFIYRPEKDVKNRKEVREDYNRKLRNGGRSPKKRKGELNYGRH